MPDKPLPSLFFQQEEFIFREGGSEVVTFSSPDQEARLYFTHSDNQLVSLRRSPFGGFVLNELNPTSIRKVSQQALDWAVAERVQSIVVHHYPDIYSPDASDLCREIMEEAGFEISYTDITQFISVADARHLHLNTLRRRMLRKCIIKGLTFQQLEPDKVKEVYPLFLESRENKGYPVTMTQEQLLTLFTKFPNNYLLFGVCDGTAVVAACIAIVVNADILYYFFTGDAHGYRDYSPVTLLIKGMYDYCIQHHFSILDLGISTDKGMLNEGLYAFKKSFGCIDSDKITFKKTL